MPKGFHCGHVRKRNYTAEYSKLPASTFKKLLTAPLGKYTYITNTNAYPIKLKQLKTGLRYMCLDYDGTQLEIGLIECNKSASSKLYITCPFCQERRQHLHQFKKGFACRTCLGLSYASQSETKQQRLASRIRKLRQKVWGSIPDINNLTVLSREFRKPQNMHVSRFEKIQNQLIQLEQCYWGLAEKQLKNFTSYKLFNGAI